MYQIFLENSMPKLAPALELLADPERLPALVHCVHGKDRTGVFVATTQLLSGAFIDDVVDDYAVSYDNLSTARNLEGTDGKLTAKIAHPEAKTNQMFLLKDSVIASEKC